jgi:hypothetical protein
VGAPAVFGGGPRAAADPRSDPRHRRHVGPDDGAAATRYDIADPLIRRGILLVAGRS